MKHYYVPTKGGKKNPASAVEDTEHQTLTNCWCKCTMIQPVWKNELADSNKASHIQRDKKKTTDKHTTQITLYQTGQPQKAAYFIISHLWHSEKGTIIGRKTPTVMRGWVQGECRVLTQGRD